jgi:hypothetical protein
MADGQNPYPKASSIPSLFPSSLHGDPLTHMVWSNQTGNLRLVWIEKNKFSSRVFVQNPKTRVTPAKIPNKNPNSIILKAFRLLVGSTPEKVD